LWVKVHIPSHTLQSRFDPADRRMPGDHIEVVYNKLLAVILEL
jgi:hypothetical protein